MKIEIIQEDRDLDRTSSFIGWQAIYLSSGGKIFNCSNKNLRLPILEDNSENTQLIENFKNFIETKLPIEISSEFYLIICKNSSKMFAYAYYHNYMNHSMVRCLKRHFNKLKYIGYIK